MARQHGDCANEGYHMKFEHLIEINDPLNPLADTMTREQLWRGLVLRDSTISIPRSRAAERALTIDTPPERMGRRMPAAALEARTSAARLSAKAP